MLGSYDLLVVPLTVDHRPATHSDLEAIASIYDHEVRTGTATFDTEPRSPAEWQAWFDAHQSPSYPVIVACSSGRIFGWASLSAWSERGAYSRTVEASVFVDREHRNRHVGADLLRELIDSARSPGHRVVLGRIETGNEMSRKLLISAGFTSVGTMHRVGEKFGRLLDVELFEFVLSSGSPPGR